MSLDFMGKNLANQHYRPSQSTRSRPRELLAWLGRNSTRKPISVAWELSVLRELYSFLLRRGRRLREPSWPKVSATSNYVPYVFTEAEVRQLLRLSATLERPVFRRALYRAREAQGFFNWRTNLVTPTDALIQRDGSTVPARYDNSGTGRAWGLEVLLRQDVTERLYGWISCTLSRSERFDKTTGIWSPVSTDQTHILTVVASYKFDFGLEAGVRFRVTTGAPYTPVQGATFNADTDSYTPLYGASNSARRGTFNQLDVRLEKQFTFDLWKFSIYLDVQNVYNASNAEETLWDYRFRESRP